MFKVREGRPDVVDLIKNGQVQLLINTPLGKKAHYDELATTHGEVPVIAIPSASALGLHGKPASYNCYAVERTGEGWQLEIASRDYQSASGEFSAGESRTVALSRGPGPG